MRSSRAMRSTVPDRRADARARITRAGVEAFRIPTDAPESDGTIEWSSTTLVLATLHVGAIEAIGYTYADTATATLAADLLAPIVNGRDAFDARAIRDELARAVRNLGRGGVAAMAISAFDNALWDLRGKLLGVP